MIFLPDVQEMIAGAEYSERYIPPPALQQIVDLCADAALVGVTVMTSSFRLASQVSDAIRAGRKTPVIWGGIHPTVRAEECLRHADLVCIGEGEEMLVELAVRLDEGRDYHDIENLAYMNAQGEAVFNPMAPLVKDLDALPLPDYDYEDHYVLHEGKMVRFTPSLMEYYMSDIGAWARSVVYGVLTTRGCPYKCSFCVNNTMVGIYDNWSRLRMRSPQNVIDEILDVKRRVPSVAGVMIRDDTFLANPKSYIRDFSRLYKEQVNLPFQAYSTARTVDREKLQLLADAGLRRLIMGIQSGSERMQKLYKRDWATNEQILAAAHVINEFREQIPLPMYDVITDSPYETDEDRFATLQLIHQLPTPYKLSIFSLTFYPGTEIYERAVEDGHFPAQEDAIYEHNFQKIHPTYYNLALYLHHKNLPKPLLWILVQRPIFTLMSRAPLDRLAGKTLSVLTNLRLRSNQRLFERRQKEWLMAIETTGLNEPAHQYA
jgi:radical SAM superfamily enzyme YgiQ (UPF0313 family)